MYSIKFLFYKVYLYYLFFSFIKGPFLFVFSFFVTLLFFSLDCCIKFLIRYHCKPQVCKYVYVYITSPPLFFKDSFCIISFCVLNTNILYIRKEECNYQFYLNAFSAGVRYLVISPVIMSTYPFFLDTLTFLFSIQSSSIFFSESKDLQQMLVAISSYNNQKKITMLKHVVKQLSYYEVAHVKLTRSSYIFQFYIVECH